MVISDALIAELLSIPKVIKNPGAKAKVQKKSERINYQVVASDSDKSFEMYTRQNQIDPDAYSCGLIYHPRSGEKVTLVRYNGSNHVHRNPLEDGELIKHKCHIHRATERYMEMGDKAEKFAETTDRYHDLAGAIRCMLSDCNISGIDLPCQDYGVEVYSQLSFDL
ncbi:hypothetical protein HB13667_07685 [Pseudomonas putida]|uniref:Uncharacterized protein n=1 Tax=Pseudomonas putida TaxID=303 RepID=A0A0P7CYU8_PSEPU|nr:MULTISPECIES: hypothetical protein [Pseudomonas]KPM67205.1 hypothetical protein HB13667_07685 [Pseudomonas putida]